MRRTNFYFPQPMLVRLKKLASQMDTTVSDVIRQAAEKLLSERGVK